MSDAPLSAPPDAEAEALLGRLAGEFTDRLAAGEHPDVEEYARRYPELASVIRQVLPALQAIGTPGGPEDPPPTAGERPHSLGDYRVVREVGRGGMGVVYEAEQVSLGRRVALKVLPFAAALDPRQLQRFKTEAQAAAHLHHQHIVPVYGVGSDRGVHYYAMQFIDGRTLAAVIQELRGRPAGAAPDADPGQAADPDRTSAYDGELAGKPAWPGRDTPPVAGLSTARSGRKADWFRRAAGLAVQAAEALEYAHQLGVVHRDIKPGNLMVDARGDLWVTDFGLARLADGAGQTATGDVVGTLRYMSPEQAAGRRDVDHRADVYSLGATLYELLALRPVFDGATPQELLRKVATEDPRPLRRHDPAVPPDLETIVLKALAKGPAERYQTARELADDLRRFLEDRPITARRPTVLQRARKWARRHRAVVTTGTVGVALLLVTAVVALAVSNALLRDEEGRTRDALHDAEAREKEAAAAHRETEAALIDMAASQGGVAGDRNDPAVASLWFAHAARLARNDPDRERTNLIRSRNWAREVPTPLVAVRHPGEKVVKVAFHPGGRSLMVLTETRCALVGVPDGRPEPLPGGDRPVTAADWTADGTRLALGLPGGTVEIFRLPGGERVQAFNSPGPVDVVRFSPDGRYLAVAGNRARVWDCQANGFATPELAHPGRVHGLLFNGRGDRLVTTAADGSARVFAVPAAGSEPLARFATRVPGPPGLLPFDPVFGDDDRLLLGHEPNGDVVWRETGGWREVRRNFGQSHHSLLAVSPDGKRFVVTRSGSGQIWDAGSGQAVGQQFSHANLVYAAAFSPDGQQLLTVGADRTARLWSTAGGAAVHPPLAHQNDLKHAAFSPDGRFFATGQADGLVRVWTVAGGNPPLRQLPAEGSGEAVALSPDGRHVILAGNWKGNLQQSRVYEVATGEAAGPYLETNGVLAAAALSPDGRTAATAALTATGPGRFADTVPGGAGQLQFWDWRTARPGAGPVPLPACPRDVTFSPDGKVAAVSCHGGQIVLVDAADGRVLARPDGGPPEPTDDRFPGVRFTPDGRSLITWGTDGAVRVWQVPDGTPRYPPLRHAGQTRDATPSQDGRLLVTGSRDNTARVWELETGRPLTDPLPHPDYVFSACLSPDGGRVLTACRDGSARVWDWRSGRLVCPPLRHPFEVWGVAFTPDGRWAVVQSRDSVVRVWDCRTGKAITPPERVNNDWYRPPVVVPDGRHAVISATLIDLGGVTEPDGLAADDLVALGELLSGHRLHDGELAGLTTDEWLDRWRAWAARRPAHEVTTPLPAHDWHRRQAGKYEAAKQWAGAAWHLERLTATEPGTADHWVRLGRARRESGQHAAAVAALDRGIQLDPNDAHAFFQRGWAHEAMKTYDKAVADFTEAIRLNPGYWRAYNSRAQNRHALGDHAGAVADATAAIRLAPHHYLPRANRANAYRDLGEIDKAIADYSEAIRLDPGYAYAYKSRGVLYVRSRKDLDRAIADYTDAIRLDPANPVTYFNRGLAHQEKGDHDRAIADFTQAVDRKYSPPAHVYGARGRSYVEKRDYDRAVADLTESIRLDPTDWRAYANRGVAYYNRKEYDRAVADTTQVIRLNPASAGAYHLRGEAYRLRGEYDRAIVDYTEAIKLDPKSADAFTNRALAYAGRSELGKAIADCDAAIRLNPTLPLPWHNRGIYRLAAGDVNGAVDDLTEATRLAPRAARSHLMRGHARATRGDWDRAYGDFARAAALEPDDPQALVAHCHLALRLGSAADYDRCCGRLFARFGGTKNPLKANDVAWACALSPHSGVDPHRLVELAELASEKDRKDLDALNTLGAALYRAGRYAEAAARLDEAVRFRDGKGVWADWLFLAMAHHRLGHPDEARRWLAKAVDWWDRAGKDGPRDGHGLPLFWSVRVEYQALRAEAEALLKTSTP